jgi:hypothetical protein
VRIRIRTRCKRASCHDAEYDDEFERPEHAYIRAPAFARAKADTLNAQ